MSFGQEIKDFLAAAQAGQKIIGAKDDAEYKRAMTRNLNATAQKTEDDNNDEEGDKLDKEGKRLSNEAKRAATALTNERRGALGDARKLADQPAVVPDYTPYRPQRAVPVEVPTPTPDKGMDMSEADPIEDTTLAPDEAVPTQLAASGGTIKKYAAGGAVEADDDEEPDDALPAEAAPAPAVPVATDVSAARRKATFSYDAASDAGKEGLREAARLLGPTGAVAAPGRQRSLRAYAQGAGAADMADMQAAQKAVDPDGAMGDSERNLAALGAVYQFKMSKGDPEGARRAAMSMIQYYRQAASRFAAITAAAVEHGDLDGASKAAMRAYANVPDGKDLKVQKTEDGRISYTFTDLKTGKVMRQGIEPPERLAAEAMGLARGGFDQALLTAAGQRAESEGKGKKGAVDPNGPAQLKPGEKKAVIGQINDAYDAQNPEDAAPDGGNGAPKRDPADAMDIKGAATRVYTHNANSHLTPDEAVAAVTKIADPTALTKSGKVTTKKVDGGYAVSLDGRHPVVVSQSDMMVLMAKRNAKLEAIKKQEEEDAKPGFAARTGKFLGDAGARLKKGALDIHWNPSQQRAAAEAGRAEAVEAGKQFTDPSIP